MSETTRSEYSVRLPNGRREGAWTERLSDAQGTAARARLALDNAGAVNQKIEILKRELIVHIGAETVHSEVWANFIPEELPTLPVGEPGSEPTA